MSPQHFPVASAGRPQTELSRIAHRSNVDRYAPAEAGQKIDLGETSGWSPASRVRPTNRHSVPMPAKYSRAIVWILRPQFIRLSKIASGFGSIPEVISSRPSCNQSSHRGVIYQQQFFQARRALPEGAHLPKTSSRYAKDSALQSCLLDLVKGTVRERPWNLPASAGPK